MAPEEVTLAELLGAAGYRTGIFGKWHLGDHYPMRAMDRGFEESLVFDGGGLAQPSDPEFFQRQDTYFDPVLRHNGVQRKCAGYCTDIFTDAAIGFVEEHRAAPFFVYLATNAPHSPLLVKDSYVAPYRAMGLPEETAKTYGMIANIDENVGRLLGKLKELGLERDTLVIFMTDNGGAGSRESQRYSAGLRAGKGTVYDGGIRVPCFVRWPNRFEGGRDIDRIAAHIDITPTLLEACGAKAPEKIRFDGTSLLPLMTGTVLPRDWPDRTLYFQWHRGDRPILYTNCAARSQQYKLVNATDLYDMEADPGEQHDVAAAHPEVVAAMRVGYEKWFNDVGATRGYDPVRIVIGSPHENPVVLTRQDWRGADGNSDPHVGHWEVHVERAGRFTIAVEFESAPADAHVEFRLGNAARSQPIAVGTSKSELSNVALDAGNGRLEAWMVQGERRWGARFVSVTGEA
jgi:arylsulfatase A-like enzyme